ncbi:hypothetical protein EIN_340750 [Entamoeba invadens IP1]|uniref:Leucine rich repeat containing protein BspA family protein n=1 Tax=Entamoeba invadens IP1 TaxID=370355 RepID=A0A0A1UE21_ENTIV|nr:hypothetical protein EIN_340750 [Entamoeba invadens IP1]ELP94737.1 hypothetical protein EIN_340750 [Entamoeba invadens IP1]|eukprot:XP_004261508.1 hypothetical protein EIN_340750 [Entamoeba invadens IP1]
MLDNDTIPYIISYIPDAISFLNLLTVSKRYFAHASKLETNPSPLTHIHTTLITQNLFSDNSKPLPTVQNVHYLCPLSYSIYCEKKIKYKNYKVTCSHIIYTSSDRLHYGITIPTDVNTLGRACYAGLESITSITIPQSIKRIEEKCFYNCSNLIAIIFTGHPQLSSVGPQAFPKGVLKVTFEVPQLDTCLPEFLASRTETKLSFTKYTRDDFFSLNEPTETRKSENVEVDVYPKTANACFALANAAFSSSKLREVRVDGPKVVEAFAFANCIYLKSAAVMGVTSLPSHVFAGCVLLKNVELSEGLYEIGSSAFEGTALPEVVLPTTVTHVGNCAFKNCQFLRKVVLDDNVESLGVGCFKSCQSLMDIHIPENLRELPAECFMNCYSLNELKKHQTIEEVGDSCFEGCESIEHAEISFRLGKKCFCGCQNLKKVVINKEAEKVNEACFFDCNQLKEITIQEGVKFFGNYCFFKCLSLEEINFPQSVQSVGYGCFFGCKNLKSKINVPIAY